MIADGQTMDNETGDYWDIERLVADLGAVRTRWRREQQHHAEYGAEGFPSRANLTKIMQATSAGGGIAPEKRATAAFNIASEAHARLMGELTAITGAAVALPPDAESEE